MFGLLRSLLLVIGLAIGPAAVAAVVSGSDVACRTSPATSAGILSLLQPGEHVEVLSRRSGWSYVDPVADPACWVANRYLTDAAMAPAAYRKPHHGRTAAAGPGRGKAKATRIRLRRDVARPARSAGRSRSLRASRRSFLYEGGGSCPCSGRNVCIGPRGGRYCITSGGNKRYGV